MTSERMQEILKNIVDFVSVANNTSEQITELVKYGFEPAELVSDFGYSKADVENVTGEELPTPAKEGFMNPPTEYIDQKVTEIVDFIDKNELPEGDISCIFRALHRQDNCLGGKIWTTADIRTAIYENFCDGSFKVKDKWIEKVLNNWYDSSDLDDADDCEWNAINDAIKETDITVNVADIIWDIEPDEFDSEAEYEAVLINLPENVEIPLSELESTSIEDWLSDTYDYCIKSFTIDGKVNKEAA
nr:hypothetical protein [uncultured Butyrivibrio sp.]